MAVRHVPASAGCDTAASALLTETCTELQLQLEMHQQLVLCVGKAMILAGLEKQHLALHVPACPLVITFGNMNCCLLVTGLLQVN